MSVTAQSIGQETGFITFNSETRLISWYTNRNVNAGTFKIEIKAELNGFYEKMSFNLEVKA
jgi:hypothetical protein